jgi:tetratricopeptide (TPR) repeat protein
LYSEHGVVAAIVAAVSPRARVFALVALAAVVASGVVVIGVLATRSDVPARKLRPGRPPLALDLGLRTDAEARALERAQTLYNRGRPRQAAEIFDGQRSLEAEVGAVLAAWPDHSLDRLRALAAANPRSALVALHLGLALYWTHRDAEAASAWRDATRAQPNTPYAVRASDFLHPRFAPGLPVFVPSFATPLRIRVLPPRRQLAALARLATRGGERGRILYGVALQRLGRPLSAEAQFAAAARIAPSDPEALSAAAVGLFDKSDPSRAFARLGPLTRQFPHAQTVRFHLGLLSIWIGGFAQARRELRLAVADDPHSTFAREARALLKRLENVRTK